VTLRVPGRHNVLNSLAAVAVGRELDIPSRRSRARWRASPASTGASRCAASAAACSWSTTTVHHPAEIEATLSAAREGLGRRLVVVFQPHRYTRTRALAPEFHRAFKDADTVIVTDVYAAGEAAIPAWTAARCRGDRQQRSRQRPLRAGHGEDPRDPRADRSPGDLVLTLGAGSVWKVGPPTWARAPRLQAPAPRRTRRTKKSKKARGGGKAPSPTAGGQGTPEAQGTHGAQGTGACARPARGARRRVHEAAMTACGEA
jgi:UDP-N-acetylmuramate--alanine ligase